MVLAILKNAQASQRKDRDPAVRVTSRGFQSVPQSSAGSIPLRNLNMSLSVDRISVVLSGMMDS